MRCVALVLALALAACSSSSPSEDAAPPPSDSGSSDVAWDAPDACDGALQSAWCAEHNAPAAYGFDGPSCSGAPFRVVDGQRVFRATGQAGCVTFSQSNVTCCN